MAMGISSTLHIFQARRANFKCTGGSPLNPSARTANNAESLKRFSSDGDSTRNHLSNLEKLLQSKEPEAKPPEVGEIGDGVNGNEGRGLLEGLNLARIWPEMKAAEEMSPRNLNRLQRLLSKSQMEYSPRNVLGRRWREYHGGDDWAGMLDPLDDNLRRELVRYGEFIQAAYHCFHSNPATSTPKLGMHCKKIMRHPNNTQITTNQPTKLLSTNNLSHLRGALTYLQTYYSDSKTS